MDFKCAAGTDVLAAVDGTVTRVYTDHRLYGATVEIEHADGVKTVYKFIEPNESLKAGATVNLKSLIFVTL